VKATPEELMRKYSIDSAHIALAAIKRKRSALSLMDIIPAASEI
jgi:hypothetical protein